MPAMAEASDHGRSAIARSLELSGDLAVLPAAYVVAAAAMLSLLAGLAIAPDAIAFVGLVAWAIYLLDRVKWRDAWIDPADADAHPRRQARLLSHRIRWRLAAIASLAAATALGTGLAPSGSPTLAAWPAALPAAAALGAFLYGGRPRRRHARPKDRIALKNAAVAASIAALCLAAVLASAGLAEAPARAAEAIATRPIALATLAIALRVAADAVWCDLDDATSDRRHRTASVPAAWGDRAAWSIGLVLSLAGAAAAIAACPNAIGFTAAIAATIGSLAMIVRRPATVRDPAELRLPIEAAIVIAVGGLLA